MITFSDAKEIVRGAEEKDWTVGTYMIEADGWDDTHFLVVRGAKHPDSDHPDPNLVIVGDVLPLVDKQTGD
jgi:hypothetical protein